MADEPKQSAAAVPAGIPSANQDSDGGAILGGIAEVGMKCLAQVAPDSNFYVAEIIEIRPGAVRPLKVRADLWVPSFAIKLKRGGATITDMSGGDAETSGLPADMNEGVETPSGGEVVRVNAHPLGPATAAVAPWPKCSHVCIEQKELYSILLMNPDFYNKWELDIQSESRSIAGLFEQYEYLLKDVDDPPPNFPQIVFEEYVTLVRETKKFFVAKMWNMRHQVPCGHGMFEIIVDVVHPETATNKRMVGVNVRFVPCMGRSEPSVFVDLLREGDDDEVFPAATNVRMCKSDRMFKFSDSSRGLETIIKITASRFFVGVLDEKKLDTCLMLLDRQKQLLSCLQYVPDDHLPKMDKAFEALTQQVKRFFAMKRMKKIGAKRNVNSEQSEGSCEVLPKRKKQDDAA